MVNEECQRYEYAKVTLSDNSIYEGECINSIANGRGKRVYEDGQIDEGIFENNELCGYGKRTYKDSKVYIGNFDKGLRDGKGRIIHTIINIKNIKINKEINGEWEKDVQKSVKLKLKFAKNAIVK